LHDHEHRDPEDEHRLDLKEATRVQGPVEAEVIKNFLESEGIPCFFKGLIVPSVHPFTADGLGEIKIFVPAKDLDTAKNLLENLNFSKEPD
jgi:hypothetical protein